MCIYIYTSCRCHLQLCLGSQRPKACPTVYCNNKACPTCLAWVHAVVGCPTVSRRFVLLYPVGCWFVLLYPVGVLLCNIQSTGVVDREFIRKYTQHRRFCFCRIWHFVGSRWAQNTPMVCGNNLLTLVRDLKKSEHTGMYHRICSCLVEVMSCMFRPK